MTDSCKEHGIPSPKFSERTGGIEVTFKLAEPIGASTILESFDDLNIRQKKIILLLNKAPSLSANDIVVGLECNVTLRTINRDLAVLKKLKLVDQQGSGRATLWKLTEK